MIPCGFDLCPEPCKSAQPVTDKAGEGGNSSEAPPSQSTTWAAIAGVHLKPHMKLEFNPQNLDKNLYLTRRENVRGDWDKCLVVFFLGNQKPTFMNVKKNAKRLWGKLGLKS